MSMFQVLSCQLDQPKLKPKPNNPGFEFRQAANLTNLEKLFEEQTEFWKQKLLDTPLNIPVGVYVGPSTCNSYTSVLGSGQKVLSYTYYSPWRTVRKQ